MDEGEDENEEEGPANADSPPARPDIELTTSTAAESLRFGREPDTEVRFHGSPGHESFSGSERTNLPEPVEAGTEYRDVRVHYRLATALRHVRRRRPPEDGGHRHR